jgi:hypothetical protein
LHIPASPPALLASARAQNIARVLAQRSGPSWYARAVFSEAPNTYLAESKVNTTVGRVSAVRALRMSARHDMLRGSIAGFLNLAQATEVDKERAATTGEKLTQRHGRVRRTIHEK